MLGAKLLNELASLNQFSYIDTVQFVPGQSITMNFRLWDSELKDRYIPGASAIVKLTLNKTDGTTLEKTATLISADDRSMQSVAITAVESEDIVGGNVVITLDELGDGTKIKKAVIQMALSKVLLDGCAC